MDTRIDKREMRKFVLITAAIAVSITMIIVLLFVVPSLIGQPPPPGG
jgi:hypothetical protein